MNVVIDEQLLQYDSIYGGGGDLNNLLEIHPEDVVKLNNAIVIDIVEDKKMESNINNRMEDEEMLKKKEAKDQLWAMRHTTEHVMNQAIVKLYPDVKLAMGPATDEGFYTDFDSKEQINEKDFPKIEKEMQRVIKSNLSLKKEILSAKEARVLFKDNPYKLEWIDDIEKRKEKISVYWTGKEFVDLCSGPHVESTGEIKAFKLLKNAGAYWHGDEKNKMLTRIYGTAFFSQKELEDYFKRIEEAEKRDHIRLGKQLDLFSIDPYVGPGLVLWHPKLSTVREIIEEYWRHEHRKRGYQYVYTPHIGLAQLWETSGHLKNFAEAMYPPMQLSAKDKDEKTVYYLKPMSCPFHVRIYKSRPRSYKELPLRWCELGTVYRYEKSGVVHGMLRVRGFTQDDAHIICTNNQFETEFNKILDFAVEMNRVFGYDNLKFYFSVRDPKDAHYVGTDEVWEFAEKSIEKILKKRKIKYEISVGGAKFYGPALDLKAVDALGREWQGTTIQLDFNLPERFGMEYTGEDGKPHVPVMLHRTLLGSMERFVGTLIEHYAGAFPVWLAPVQVKLLSFTEKNMEYCKKIEQKLIDAGIRLETDYRSETVPARVRDAEMEKVPYILLAGGKEEENDTIAVRARGQKPKFGVKMDDFVKQVLNEIEAKK